MTDPRSEQAVAVRARRPWSDALWLAVPVLAGLVQLIRGEAFDAVVFLVPALLLAADSAGALPRPRRARTRLRRILPAAAVGAGTVLAVTPRHGLADGAAVVLLGVAVLVAAWPDPPRAASGPSPLLRRSGAVWAALAVGTALWELAAFLLGLPSAAATFAHPAISDLLDPVADTVLGRVALVAAWTLAGLALLRRSRP